MHADRTEPLKDFYSFCPRQQEHRLKVVPDNCCTSYSNNTNIVLAGVQPGDLEAAGGKLWTSTMLSCLMALRRVKGMTINGSHAYYPC